MPPVGAFSYPERDEAINSFLNRCGQGMGFFFGRPEGLPLCLGFHWKGLSFSRFTFLRAIPLL